MGFALRLILLVLTIATLAAPAAAFGYANQPTRAQTAAVTADFPYDGNFMRLKGAWQGKTSYTAYSRQSGALAFQHQTTDNIRTDFVALPGGASVRFANNVATYTYADHLGNLRNQTFGARQIAINYDAAKNRVASVTDTASPARAFAYDARGNTTNDGRNAFAYDFANQPTGSSTAGHTYAYDGNFKRAKFIRAGATFYDAYSRVTGKLAYRDNATAGAAFEIETVGPLSVAFLGGAFDRYHHLDHLGTRLASSDAAGAVLERERFTPFGEQIAASRYNNFPLGFTGHSRDAETNLNYMQARFYDPIIGRFLSTDPIGYQDQLNLYAYVANDPVNKTDPTGTCFENTCPINIGLSTSQQVSINQVENQAGALAAVGGAAFFAGAAVAAFAPEIVAAAPAITEATAVAAEAVAPGAGAATLAGAGTKTAVEFVTKGKSIPNIKAGITKGTFEKNLTKSGFEKSVSKDGKANNFTKGDKTISTRDTAKSTGGPSADVRVNDQPVSKIRFDEDLDR